VVLRTDFASGNANNVFMNPHPIAKVFAPAVFLLLALLSVGMSFGSADAPASPDAAPTSVASSQ